MAPTVFGVPTCRHPSLVTAEEYWVSLQAQAQVGILGCACWVFVQTEIRRQRVVEAEKVVSVSRQL